MCMVFEALFYSITSDMWWASQWYKCLLWWLYWKLLKKLQCEYTIVSLNNVICNCMETGFIFIYVYLLHLLHIRFHLHVHHGGCIFLIFTLLQFSLLHNLWCSGVCNLTFSNLLGSVVLGIQVIHPCFAYAYSYISMFEIWYFAKKTLHHIRERSRMVREHSRMVRERSRMDREHSRMAHEGLSLNYVNGNKRRQLAKQLLIRK